MANKFFHPTPGTLRRSVRHQQLVSAEENRSTEKEAE